MAQAGQLTSLLPGATLEGLRQPLRHLIQSKTRARRTAYGRLYEGDGQPLIVFPMQGCGPESTHALRRCLADAGFAPHDWGHGVDNGPGHMGLSRWLRKLEECVIDVFEITQRPVTLLGWGLSGIYARELAKRTNPLVRQVITIGSPFNTAADPLRQCKLFKMLDAGPERMPLAVRNRLRQCPPVPSTSLYSKADGVVRWEQCVDSGASQSENIEIPGARHDELPTHPRSLEVITHRLAQPEDQWKPFQQAGWLMT